MSASLTTPSSGTSSAADTATFQVFATLLKAQSGLSIGPEKQYLLESRLAPILKQEGLANLPALAQRLRGGLQTALSRAGGRGDDHE